MSVEGIGTLRAAAGPGVHLTGHDGLTPGAVATDPGNIDAVIHPDSLTRSFGRVQNGGGLVAGNNDWTIAGRIATCSLTEGEQSKALKFDQFGFEVPSDATIDGIEVTFRLSSPDGRTQWDAAVLHTPSEGDGSDFGLAGSDTPNHLSDVIVGGPAELFGLLPTPADLNDPAFYTYFSLDGSTEASADLSTVTACSVTVYLSY